jgi:hypothetical protein
MTSQQRAEIQLRAQQTLEQILQDPNVRELLRKYTRVPLSAEWMDGSA